MVKKNAPRESMLYFGNQYTHFFIYVRLGMFPAFGHFYKIKNSMGEKNQENRFKLQEIQVQ